MTNERSRTGLRGVDHDLFMILRRSNPLPIKCKDRILDVFAHSMHIER